MDHARVVGSEQAFLIGVRVLSGHHQANQAGGAYALLAERLIACSESAVEVEMTRQHGEVASGSRAVLAMGKLGGHEMTAASDIDLILVYDFDPRNPDVVVRAAALSAEPVLCPFYAAPCLRRCLGADHGRPLYEVDMRLRPSGQKGPVATQLVQFHPLSDQCGLDLGAHGTHSRSRRFGAARAVAARVEAAIRDSLLNPARPR